MTPSSATPASLVPAQKIITPEEMTAGLLSLPNMMETQLDEVEHVIVYGEPGNGKTTIAGLLSEFFNILWLDGDKGLTALKYNLHPEMLKRIVPIRIPDNTQYPIMVSTILRLLRGTATTICLEHGATDCVVCRNNKEAKVVNIALNQLPKSWIVVMDSQTQFYASVLAFSYYKDTGKAPGTDVPEEYRGNWDYRGIAYNCCDKFGNYMKDLRCQWVSISHELMSTQEDNTNKIVPVAGSANISASYGKWFGTMVHAKKANGKLNYSTSTTYSNLVQTKSRSNVQLEKKETPSLLHVFRPGEAEALLKGSYNEWYLKEGFKDIKDRVQKVPPTPKGILPC